MRSIATLVLAASMGLAGCEGENLFANSDPDLVNETQAFTAVRMVFDNGAGQSVDLVAQGALFELILDLDENRFESSFQFDDIDVDVSGTVTAEDGSLTFSDDPFVDDEVVTERTLGFEDAGDVIFLDDPAAVWDVDNDGVAEVATLEIRLERPSS